MCMHRTHTHVCTKHTDVYAQNTHIHVYTQNTNTYTHSCTDIKKERETGVFPGY